MLIKQNLSFIQSYRHHYISTKLIHDIQIVQRKNQHLFYILDLHELHSKQKHHKDKGECWDKKEKKIAWWRKAIPKTENAVYLYIQWQNKLILCPSWISFRFFWKKTNKIYNVSPQNKNKFQNKELQWNIKQTKISKGRVFVDASNM